MSKLLRLLLLPLLGAGALFAQTPPWEVGAAYVPSSGQVIASQTVHVQRLVLVNTSGAAVTVTLTDHSTNCGGSACAVFSASIAANTTYTVDLGGARAMSGLSWSASTDAVVAGWVKGTY